MEPTVVGVDIAKRVFQLHWIAADTGEVFDKQLRRSDFLEHFANREPCLIGMEACGGSQHWARRLTELGHQVKLMPGKLVKAFVTGNKNDVADARAIWAAARHPGVKAVPVKTEAQQAVLALHRIQQQLVIFRRSQSNCLRGLLGEYGEVMGVGRAAMNRAMPDLLLRLELRLPRVLIDSLREGTRIPADDRGSAPQQAANAQPALGRAAYLLSLCGVTSLRDVGRGRARRGYPEQADIARANALLGTRGDRSAIPDAASQGTLRDQALLMLLLKFEACASGVRCNANRVR